MESFQFKALGTAWSISIDQAVLVDSQLQPIWNEVIAHTTHFEQRFSRFIETSESRAFSTANPGTYTISTEMCTLLSAADHLRTLTDGSFNPAVGGLLEAAGYNKSYRLTEDKAQVTNWKTPIWSLQKKEQTITIDGPVIFDFGGIGKGYWIDQISALLTSNDFPHHLVEGGGDMMATTKANGEGWRVAIEYPGKPDTALGLYILKNKGFAASDVYKRNWGKWHHFIDLKHKKPTRFISGCVAVASSAWVADQITSVLATCHPDDFERVIKQIGGEYVVLLSNGEALISQNWEGELF